MESSSSAESAAAPQPAEPGPKQEPRRKRVRGLPLAVWGLILSLLAGVTAWLCGLPPAIAVLVGVLILSALTLAAMALVRSPGDEAPRFSLATLTLLSWLGGAPGAVIGLFIRRRPAWPWWFRAQALAALFLEAVWIVLVAH